MEKDLNINLEEISKLPDKELKKHFREWLEKDDIAKQLQAKLRKDLFASFNKTSLGRKMFAQHIKSQGIILSPLILVLNTLIAEFLYAQKCHFSLSVFCTEVPYRNLFPDFENIQNFRFKKSELFEILEAIDTKMPMELKKSICVQYFESKSEKPSISLLYIIFKNIFDNIKNETLLRPQEMPTTTNNQQQIKENNNNQQDNNTKKLKKDGNSTLNNSNLRYLNKYLIILSKKVKEMSLHLEKLEQKDTENLNKTLQDIKTKKYEHLNRKLTKISENLNLLSTRKYKQTSSILNAIQQLAKQFDKCATNFLNISKKQNKTYDDWINELKTSKSGRKFISKIESSLRKTLEAERIRVAKEFSEKMENEKELLKLKYKQKYSEQLHKVPKNQKHCETQVNDNNIDEKLKEFSQKHDELLKRVSETENLIKTATLEKKQINNEVNQTEEVKNLIIKSPKSQLIQDIAPQLQGLAKSIAQQERNIDHIVFDAKLRIQELEHESIQLDRNFQDYLQRQKMDNKRTDKNASSIWQNYTMEKERLNKKCAILRNQPQRNPTTNIVQNSIYENMLLQIPEIHLNTEPIFEEKPNKDITEILNFENPFRKLQNTLLITKERQNETKRKLKYENSTNIAIEKLKSINPNTNQLKNKPKLQDEVISSLINETVDKYEIKLPNYTETEIKSPKSSPIKSPIESDKENTEKISKRPENPQNEKGLSQFIIGKTTKKLSPTSENIFQIGTLLKDEEVNRILESSESINSSRRDNKFDISPRLPPPYERSPSNLSKLSGNISFENNGNNNKSPDSSFWN